MREKQAAQMAAAFLSRSTRAMGKLRLLKLMYLAEREAMRRFFLPIVEDDICAMQRGMGLSETWRLARGRSANSTGEWADHIVKTQQGLGVRKGVSVRSLDGLSEDDLDVIQSVWDDYGAMKEDDLVHDVHHKLPEWIDHWEAHGRRGQSVTVPYAALYQTICDMDETDTRYLIEEYRAARDCWIKSDPDILGGTPVVVGTRVSVYAIHGRLVGGDRLVELEEDYPHIPREAFLAANMYAKAHPFETHPCGRPWEASAKQVHSTQD